MELRHLRYFAAVAEAGNLSRAAVKLNIAQPPLSTQIRLFEEELGVALFIRHPKGVRLTTAGQALLPEARYLLERASRLADVAREASHSGNASSIGVGFIPSASSIVLPSLMRLLRKQHPRLHIELHELISSDQTDALIAGRIDAGIVRLTTRHPRLCQVKSIRDPLCLAFPSSSAPRASGPIDLRRFSEHDYVAFAQHKGVAYSDHANHTCIHAGFSPRVRYEASTVHGVLDLVSASLGIALVPASSSLLGVKGIAFRALRQKMADEFLALLRRKVDPNPVLSVVEASVEATFASISQRISHLVSA
ncbi:DNA-binding transcriptional regulator, LysR family [Variovorax sp. YR752]|uniref:LysR family transcriptional regulator n=1 Tax=Variovorax sp. YR752 TaxID=1884383 RepID=UPI000BCCCBBA|nr:LysR substrate-binding domain-containing protein [Variovorax sp. YR752]SOE06234.1 DNA-binding transcriptional regulator, LysR family [Variovorax sp. YR752]